jgi:4-hydroxybenzoate polyprenyltransferase
LRLRVLLRMIKVEHTLFSLPFAYLGAILGAKGAPPSDKLLWISLAMLGAHSAGMAVNRLVDLEFDALNPRTQDRALPCQLVTSHDVYWFVFFSLALFFVASACLNRICLMLSPIAAFALVFYSYTKRFTYLCHFWLGFVLALAPVGGWLGVTGRFNLPPFLLGLGICLWVAGFDVIYQSADVSFDARMGLYSIPRCFGIRPSMKLVLLLHLFAVVFFFLVGYTALLGVWYYVGLLVVLAVFVIEAKIILGGVLEEFMEAFDMNLVVSSVLLASALLDLFISK